MKLAQAIEILGDTCWDYIPEREIDIRDAIKLGIEALKRLEYQRKLWMPTALDLLPGETED